MTSTDASTTGRRGGRPDKRDAILCGALTVFARDGHARASIDAIAVEACVSTRTIYNHFGDKARLFTEVIRHSSTAFAAAQLAVIDRHLWKVTDLAADLTAMGLALAAPTGPEHAKHLALVRGLTAGGHVPREAVAVWHENGPGRVHRDLARHFAGLAERGLLRAEDPERAAHHYMLLVAGSLPCDGDAPGGEVATAVAAAVRTFLHGHIGHH